MPADLPDLKVFAACLRLMYEETPESKLCEEFSELAVAALWGAAMTLRVTPPRSNVSHSAITSIKPCPRCGWGLKVVDWVPTPNRSTYGKSEGCSSCACFVRVLLREDDIRGYWALNGGQDMKLSISVRWDQYCVSVVLA